MGEKKVVPESEVRVDSGSEHNLTDPSISLREEIDKNDQLSESSSPPVTKRETEDAHDKVEARITLLQEFLAVLNGEKQFDPEKINEDGQDYIANILNRDEFASLLKDAKVELDKAKSEQDNDLQLFIDEVEAYIEFLKDRSKHLEGLLSAHQDSSRKEPPARTRITGAFDGIR